MDQLAKSILGGGGVRRPPPANEGEAGGEK
jgi:hypothetical protein